MKLNTLHMLKLVIMVDCCLLMLLVAVGMFTTLSIA